MVEDDVLLDDVSAKDDIPEEGMAPEDDNPDGKWVVSTAVSVGV
jgi:hypothetical protein